MLKAFAGPITAVHTTQKHAVLERVQIAGKEFIYLKGVASVAAGSWVKFDEAGQTTLLAADAVGPVAIAMGAIIANTWGFFQIWGLNIIAKTDTIAADAALYIDGTAGRADDAVVSGDLIVGATSQTADTTNVASVFLNYPHVTNVLG